LIRLDVGINSVVGVGFGSALGWASNLEWGWLLFFSFICCRLRCYGWNRVGTDDALGGLKSGCGFGFIVVGVQCYGWDRVGGTDEALGGLKSGCERETGPVHRQD
jgi:hypothetical protein